MVNVKLTSALKKFFPSITDLSLKATTVKEVIDNLELKYPGLSSYLVDDNGKLRQHVNIFVKGKLINDREFLTDVLSDRDEVVIFQALSGG